MPLSYTIDRRDGIITITGEYSSDTEWRALLTAVLRDPDYRRGLAFLRDLRAAKYPVDASTVVRIMGVVREFWPALGATRGAIVTSRHLEEPAVIAHALAEAEQLPLRAFTSYEAAVEWLRERPS